MLHRVEIGSVFFPVMGISDYADNFFGFELVEFEWSRADRMTAHVARGDMTGVHGRPPGCQKRDKGRLPPLQMKGDLVVAIGGHLAEVVVPGFAGIDAKLFVRLVGQHVPGAFDVCGGKGLAVVPLNALPQRQSQHSSVLAP